MNPDHNVYDDGHDEEPVTRPDLHARETEDNGSHPVDNQDDSEQSEGSEESGSGQDDGDDHFVKSGKGKSRGEAALGASELAGAEGADGKSFPGSQFGFNANPLDKTPLGIVKGMLSRNKKKALIGGGVGAGIAGLLIGGFFILLPLKIEHMVQNLENHFFASAQNAMENEVDNTFTNWVKKQLGPAMKMGDCSKQGKMVISKDCTIHTPSNNNNNPVLNLYKTWSDAKLENKLADEYGIELIYDNSKGGTYYLKAPGISGKTKVGDAAGIGSEFDKVDRGTVRQAFKDAEKGMTIWDKVMFRYKVGRLLEQKYGIKRCIVFCGVKDAFANDKADKKYAAKAFLVERVITPRSASLGAVIDCLINNSCDSKQSKDTCTESTCDELAGEAQTQADAEAEQELTKVVTKFGSELADKLIKGIVDIRAAGGITKWILIKVLEKLGMQQFSDFAGALITWIPKLAEVLAILPHLGPDSQKLSYIVNSQAAVSIYMMYRTYADEIHTGHVDPTELGSFTGSLGAGDQCVPALEGKCDIKNQKGGTATAEAAPEYSYLMQDNTGGSATTALLDSVLPSKAYAASKSFTSESSGNYLCDNHKPVPKGKRVCDEEMLGRGNSALVAISNFVKNNSALNFITQAAGLLNGILSIPSQLFSDAVSALMSDLGIQIPDFILKAIEPLFMGLANDVVNDPFSIDMSGARTFDMMAAGADVAGNTYAQTGIGGMAMNNAQTAAILTQQQEEAAQEFQKQPLFARLFNTSDPMSLVSKVAMDVPFDFQNSLVTSFASFISNPLSLLENSFASLFSGKVSAAATPQSDSFGVTQYGYPGGVPADPQSYWDTYCTNDASKGYQKDGSWDAAGANTTDPNTGEPLNTNTNPCLLIMATVGSAGGAFDTSNLTSSDLADVNGGASVGSGQTTGTGNYQSPFHNESGLVKSRVDEGVDFASTQPVPIYAIGDGTVTEATSSSTFYTTSAGHADWITYQLTSGPASGKYIYIAEGCSPILVKAGQTVNSSTQLCSVLPDSIETGWAVNATGQAAAARDSYKEGHATAYGQNFEEFLTSLGVQTKACYDHPGEPLEGSLPSGWPQWTSSPATNAGSTTCG